MTLEFLLTTLIIVAIPGTDAQQLWEQMQHQKVFYSIRVGQKCFKQTVVWSRGHPYIVS